MENKELNPLDALFRNGMEGRESVPPSASWAQMESLLDAQGPALKKKKPVFWYWAAAAILPFLLFSIWFFGFNTRKAEMDITNTDDSGKQNVPALVIEEKRSEKIAASETLERQVGNKTKAQSLASNINKAHNIPSEKKDRIEDQNLISNKIESVQPFVESAIALETTNGTINSKPMEDIEQMEKSKEPDYEIASMEFKSGKSNNKIQEDQLASVEWKRAPKTSLSEKISNIKTGQIKNFPTIGEAKESLFALLSPVR